MARSPFSDVPAERLFRRGDDGYNLVILIILVTLLNIIMAAALPVWSSVAKLDKEEELIFRGLQYAEAIRVFRIRYNRYPVKLEELIEVEPRCIRQLWKDPMTEDGKWGLVFAGAGRGLGGVAPGATPPRQPQPHDNDDGNQGQDLVPQGENPVDAGNPVDASGRVTVGPIQGVFSRSSENSAKVFLGQTQYDQWRFTEQLVLASVGVRRPGNNNQIPNLSVRWVGRPLPSFIPQSRIPQGGEGGSGASGGGAPQDLSPSGGVVGTPPQRPSPEERP